jgi:hypothetical protein
MVMDLHSGTNDVSHLVPGVYFISSADPHPAARVVILN